MNIPTASIASYHPLHLQAALTCSHLCFLRVCFSSPILFHVLPYLYSVAVGASVCVLLCRGNVITERSASFSSCNGSSVCLYGCSAYARPIYNLDPFCVLDNLYSVAVDASIPLLCSHGIVIKRTNYACPSVFISRTRRGEWHPQQGELCQLHVCREPCHELCPARGPCHAPCHECSCHE